MGNFLNMNEKEKVVYLAEELKWSIRRISRETGISRNTIGVCLENRQSKLSQVSTGKKDAKPTGQISKCEPHREIIEEKFRAGQHGMSIYYDLKETGFEADYKSVQRFLRQLKKEEPELVGRVITQPGEEGQVDYGDGAPTKHPTRGDYRRPNLFVMTLSCSGKHFSEVTWHQTQEEWVESHRRSFESFGGVPRIIVIDNLKAGVEKAEWYDPTINRLYEACSKHYGFEVLPCRPGKPEHKGKTERGIQYVQDMLAGRRFESIEEQNEFLMRWEERAARWRIHGRTKKQVQALFEEKELPALLRLPAESFELFQSGMYRVGRDGFVEVRRAYYAVPGYVGRRVEARWTSKLVRIYDPAGLILITHLRRPAGSVSALPDHPAPAQIFERQRYEKYLLEKVAGFGNEALAWAREALKSRGAIGLRVVLGLLSLGDKYGRELLSAACAHALAAGTFRYHVLKEFCQGSPQPVLPVFNNTAEVIRPLSDYTDAAEHQL